MKASLSDGQVMAKGELRDGYGIWDSYGTGMCCINCFNESKSIYLINNSDININSESNIIVEF